MPEPTEQNLGEPIEPRRLTWAMMLGVWVDFAKSAVALPDDVDGRRMRDSINDIIMLQAVWFALGDLGQLSHDERLLGIDRAGVLIDKHAAALGTRWGGDMPDLLAEIIADARDRHAAAQTADPLQPGDDTPREA